MTETEPKKRSSGVLRLIREHPQFSSLPPHCLMVLAWALRYGDDYVPSREDVMRALLAMANAARG